MYVRLAFATAISTNPDILIIDEALSVGDALFQHRCLRRIKEMQENGTTILFVSHDPSAIKALCARAILLNGGRVDTDGKPSDVLNRYQGLIMEREEAYEAGQSIDERDGDAVAISGPIDETSLLVQKSPALHYTFRHGDRSAEVLSAEMLDASRRNADLIETGDGLIARLRVRFHREIDEPVFGFLIRNRHGIHAYGANTEQMGLSFGKVLRGEIIEVSFSFDCWLGTELYSVSYAVHSADGISYDWLDGVLFFRVASAVPVEGIANLNASASMRRVARVNDSTDKALSDRASQDDSPKEVSAQSV
jgi:hypothetical protein